MNSKERVYAAVKGEKTDRAPLFMWYSPLTKKNLASRLNIREADVEEYLGNDVMQDWLSINRQMSLPCEEGNAFIDEWGITWKREGAYNAVVKHPLEALSAEEIAKYPFPDPFKPERYTGFLTLKRKYPDKFIGADVSGSLFEPAYHLRGMENLLVDMMTEEDAADILLDKIAYFTKAVCVEAAKSGADWIWLGDDYGTQQSMIASLPLWQRYFKPRLFDIINAVKQVKENMIFAYHSCGSVFPIIAELKEIGIDVINPLQESALGMEHDRIREAFPSLTMFCGLDTQQYLVNAKSEEVYQASLKKINELGKSGRFIFGSSHTIQHDVPVENILAMIKAAKD